MDNELSYLVTTSDIKSRETASSDEPESASVTNMLPSCIFVGSKNASPRRNNLPASPLPYQTSRNFQAVSADQVTEKIPMG